MDVQMKVKHVEMENKRILVNVRLFLSDLSRLSVKNPTRVRLTWRKANNKTASVLSERKKTSGVFNVWYLSLGESLCTCELEVCTCICAFVSLCVCVCVCVNHCQTTIRPGGVVFKSKSQLYLLHLITVCVCVCVVCVCRRLGMSLMIQFTGGGGGGVSHSPQNHTSTPSIPSTPY